MSNYGSNAIRKPVLQLKARNGAMAYNLPITDKGASSTQMAGIKQEYLNNYYNTDNYGEVGYTLANPVAMKSNNATAKAVENFNPTYVESGRNPPKLQEKEKTSSGSGGGGSYTVNANNQPYVDQLNALYDQIINRKPFQYDLNGDLLYRQMADQYTQLGQQAMRDATGQAAALTGGYGNSYANQVGNQAYQQYLTALNEQIPALYDRALNTWQAQGDDLLRQYELAAAHPGYLDAISPKTYYAPAAQDVNAGAADTTSSSYKRFLEAVLLNRGTVPTASSQLPFEDWVYRRNSTK